MESAKRVMIILSEEESEFDNQNARRVENSSIEENSDLDSTSCIRGPLPKGLTPFLYLLL